MNHKVKCQNTSEYAIAAEKLIKQFAQNKIFAFEGAMGVGKTTFIKAICEYLGVMQIVTSPTFSIVNEYVGPNNQPVYHFDFYRINKLSEIYDLGYEEYLYSGNYCFIEWPAIMGELLPQNIVYVKMYEENEIRFIEY